MGDVTFDIDAIVDESRKAAGLDDFGPQDFRTGLEALVATCDGGRFNERGRVRGRRRLVQLLTTRLRMLAVFGADHTAQAAEGLEGVLDALAQAHEAARWGVGNREGNRSPNRPRRARSSPTRL